MRIDDHHTSSDIFSGCAAWDALKAKAKAAYNWFKGGAIWLKDLIANPILAVGRGLVDLLAFRIKQAKDIVIGAWGSFVNFLGGLHPCVKLLLAGAVATTVLIGGLWGLSLLSVGNLVSAGLVTIGARIALAKMPGNIIRWLVLKTHQIINFNWNVSDKQLEQNQKAAMTRLAGVAGATLGTTLGGLACGAVAGIGAVKLNLATATKVWEVLGDDTKDEICEAWGSFIRVSGQLLNQRIFTYAFSNFRRLVKTSVANSSEFKKTFPEFSKSIDLWGRTDSKPWSIAIAIEDRLEKLEDTHPNWANFLEEFLEEFDDVCTDTVVAISYAMA